MKQIIISSIVSLTFFASLWAQENPSKFMVEVSTDSVLMGNYFEVKFTLENASGQNFEPPAFEDFNVVSGPNQSSNFTVVNGEMSQNISYTYYLEPLDIGSFYIQPASIETKDEVLETYPVEVFVLPNPDGIKQRPPQREDRHNLFDDYFGKPLPKEKMLPKPKKKKKRKTYRI